MLDATIHPSIFVSEGLPTPSKLNILILGNGVRRPSETIRPANLMYRLKRIQAVFFNTNCTHVTYTTGDRKRQVFYDYAKEMKIWRVPEAHLDTPEKYSDRGREYWQVWNREVPISEFVEREAPKYIQVRLHSHLGEVQRGCEYWQVWNREVSISEFT